MGLLQACAVACRASYRLRRGWVDFSGSSQLDASMPAMKRILARLLQAAVLLIGIAALVFLLWEPQLEGRNAHATLFQVYFNDPFLAFAYLGSLAFFAAAYQLFRMLGQVSVEGAFPPTAPEAFRFIRKCAITIVGFVAVGEVFIFLHESDDRAGGVAMGVLIALGSTVVALVASKFERSLRPAN